MTYVYENAQNILVGNWSEITVIGGSRYSRKGPRKICGRRPFKNLQWYGLQADHITTNFLKAVCLPQILLGPFMNTLTQFFFPLDMQNSKTLAHKIVRHFHQKKELQYNFIYNVAQWQVSSFVTLYILQLSADWQINKLYMPSNLFCKMEYVEHEYWKAPVVILLIFNWALVQMCSSRLQGIQSYFLK